MTIKLQFDIKIKKKCIAGAKLANNEKMTKKKNELNRLEFYWDSREVMNVPFYARSSVLCGKAFYTTPPDSQLNFELTEEELEKIDAICSDALIRHCTKIITESK